MIAIDQRPWGWALLATVIVYVWAVIFWYLFFNLLSWEVLQIPMGLGGALYPVFFTIPVLVATGIYEIVIVKKRRGSNRIQRHYLLITLWIPVAAVSLALILLCPMDTEMSYLEYLFTRKIF